MNNPEAMKDGQFWDRFGRGALLDNRPTPQEAADFVVSQMVEIKVLKENVTRLERELKIAGQQYDVFLMEVASVANKYRR